MRLRNLASIQYWIRQIFGLQLKLHIVLIALLYQHLCMAPAFYLGHHQLNGLCLFKFAYVRMLSGPGFIAVKTRFSIGSRLSHPPKSSAIFSSIVLVLFASTFVLGDRAESTRLYN